MSKIPNITILQYLCNISNESQGINMIFHAIFCKMVLSFLLVIASYAKSTQNIFAISPKKLGWMKLMFFMQINFRVFYKLILLILISMGRHVLISQNNKFGKSLSYLKEEFGDEIEFLCRWASMFPIIWCYHFRWTWPSMPKLLKTTSI